MNISGIANKVMWWRKESPDFPWVPVLSEVRCSNCGSTNAPRQTINVDAVTTRGRKGIFTVGVMECADCDTPDIWIDYTSLSFDREVEP